MPRQNSRLISASEVPMTSNEFQDIIQQAASMAGISANFELVHEYSDEIRFSTRVTYLKHPVIINVNASSSKVIALVFLQPSDELGPEAYYSLKPSVETSKSWSHATFSVDKLSRFFDKNGYLFK